MREIKFRAWNKENKTMNQVKELSFVAHQDGRLSMIDAGWRHVPEKFELMQFTGLHDKNDKEIYEGDIIKNRFGTGIVRFMFDRFLLENPNHIFPYGKDNKICQSTFPIGGKERKIIGNIYENFCKFEGLE